jgi:hypothetical protein
MPNKNDKPRQKAEAEKQKREADKKAKLEAKRLKRLKRQQEGEIERNEPRKEPLKSFLIFCVGENTEPDYFNHFKCSTIDVKCIGKTPANSLKKGTAGKDPMKMVEMVLGKDNKEGQKDYYNEQRSQEGKTPYDEVWIVFDKDNFPNNNFDKAIKEAKAHKIKVAWSNQAFEYWLILHFDDHQGGGLHRKDYDELINKYLNPHNITYNGKGSKEISPEMFEILASINPQSSTNTPITLRQQAYNRAKRNYEWHQEQGNKPSNWESCTTVFELVAALDPSINP